MSRCWKNHRRKASEYALTGFAEVHSRNVLNPERVMRSMSCG
jgi:hypothetical protein